MAHVEGLKGDRKGQCLIALRRARSVKSAPPPTAGGLAHVRVSHPRVRRTRR